MTLGLRDSRTRRRRQVRWRIIKTVFFIAAAIAAGIVAYQGGSLLARQEVIQLQQEVAELESDVIALQRRNDDLLAETQEAKTREGEWRSKYQAEVPQGENKALYQRVQQKLAAGVDPERLAFIIEATENTRTCEPETETKRFIVRTPHTKGGNDAISFAKKTITVTASGEPATSEAGNAEAWYDPAKPITVRFTEIGGRESESVGILPLHHAVVIGDTEHRFTVLAGQRGFVSVSQEQCAFP